MCGFVFPPNRIATANGGQRRSTTATPAMTIQPTTALKIAAAFGAAMPYATTATPAMMIQPTTALKIATAFGAAMPYATTATPATRIQPTIAFKIATAFGAAMPCATTATPATRIKPTIAFKIATTFGEELRRSTFNTCDSDPTNDCVQDCAGVWGGFARSDRCVCDDDPNNDCSQDCLGVWGGENYLDACRVCDDDPTNDCEAACQLASGPDAGVSSTDGGVASCSAAEEANCGPGTLAPTASASQKTKPFTVCPFRQWLGRTAACPTPSSSQGFAGYYSHNGRQRYAVDFNVPIGTPIAAARAGYVFAVKEDSSSNCPSVSCSADSNYLRIMHGDGTETLFAPQHRWRLC